MFDKLEIVRTAQALSAHAGARQAVIARNVANADTPGYKAQDLPDFAATVAGGEAMRATRPGHLGGTGAGLPDPVPLATPGAASPDGNTVSLEGEMVRAVQVRQQHEMALAVYRSVSEITRTALGRGR